MLSVRSVLLAFGSVMPDVPLAGLNRVKFSRIALTLLFFAIFDDAWFAFIQ